MTPDLSGNTNFWFWQRWVVAHTLIVALMIAAGLIINYIHWPIVGWVLIGVPVGLGEQWLLSRHIRVKHWALFTSVGWVIGILLGKTAVGWQARGWDVDWALVGFSVGIAQYFVLRRHVNGAIWWILASSTALVLAGLLGGATALLEDWFMFKGLIALDKAFTEAVGFVLAGAAGGAVGGAITGGWLIWLLRSGTGQKKST